MIWFVMGWCGVWWWWWWFVVVVVCGGVVEEVGCKVVAVVGGAPVFAGALRFARALRQKRERPGGKPGCPGKNRSAPDDRRHLSPHPPHHHTHTNHLQFDMI